MQFDEFPREPEWICPGCGDVVHQRNQNMPVSGATDDETGKMLCAACEREVYEFEDETECAHCREESI